MKKKFEVDKLSCFFVPIIVGIAACANAVAENRKNQKIDEMIEKIDNLETNKEEA